MRARLFLVGYQVSFELGDCVVESDFRGVESEEVAGVSSESEGLPQFAQCGCSGFPFIRWHIFFVFAGETL